MVVLYSHVFVDIELNGLSISLDSHAINKWYRKLNGDTYIRDRLKFVSPPTRREPTPSRRSYPLYENVCRFWKVRRHCRRRNLGQEERREEVPFAGIVSSCNKPRLEGSSVVESNLLVRFPVPRYATHPTSPPLRHPRRCFCALSRLAAFNECNTISSSRQRIRNQLNGFIRFPVHCAWKVRVEERKEKRRGESWDEGRNNWDHFKRVW